MRIIYVTRRKVDYQAESQRYGRKNISFSCIPLPRVFKKDRFLSKKKIVWQELLALFKLTLHVGKLRGSKVYSTGGQYACMLLFKMLSAFLGKEAHLYIHNFYLHGLANHKIVKRVMSFLLGQRITLIVQTPAEMKWYRELSKSVDLQFVPYCMNYTPPLCYVTDNYVFTGGYTNRDYEIMKKLAERMPTTDFVFVVSKLNGDITFPDNVTVYRDIPTSEFQPLLTKAKLVVVPLKEDVGSSGQMLCLQAMRNRKPIVFCDISCISYYFSPVSGYPYRMGDIDSLCSAVESAMKGEIDGVGENAYKESLKYTKEKEREMVDAILGLA